MKQKILTSDGVKDASQLMPGDYVYEYGTSKMLEVKYVEERHHEHIHYVTYSDNRMEIYGESEKILFGDKICDINQFHGKVNEYIPMQRHVIDFGKLIPPLRPDAYTAGAIIASGDINDAFVSISANSDKVIDNILHVNQWDVYQESGNRIYFQKLGSDRKMTWDDAFDKTYVMFMRDYQVDSPIIPFEYQMNKPEERIKFIRGAFDSCYSPKVTPDTLSIEVSDDRKVFAIQTMLWGLGILSYWIYTNKGYQLHIIGPEKDYAAFFYDIENRTRMINTDYTVYKCDPTFELFLSSVNRSDVYDDEDWVYFETEKPGAIYYSANYLPRVSL